MATIHLCLDREGQPHDDVTLESLPLLMDEGVRIVWIDVDVADDEAFEALQHQFHLHALAVEDARDRRQRPKYRLYDDMLFLEFYGLGLVDDEIEPQELAIFVGENFVITVRQDDTPSLDGILRRWHDQRAAVLSERLAGNGATSAGGPNGKTAVTPMHLVYTILDQVVDNSFPAIEWLGDRIADVEDAVIDGEMHQVEIHALRRQVLRTRRVLAPEQEVLNLLLRRDVPLMDEALIPYFADIHDHVLRIHDWTETYRDQLTTITDIQVSLQSQRLDRTVRTLTVWSIILMVCGLVAGIYGMNFRDMPELGWRYGYPGALGLMAISALSVGLYFRRRDWW